jgi:hypothetical protein
MHPVGIPMKDCVYFPAPQARHDVAASKVLNDPAPHASHATAPCSNLYVPAAHGVQGPPSGPVWPAMHRQSVMSLLPALLRVSDGHGRQP